MARPRHLFVFCYDVSRDSDRARLSDLLEAALTRVQRSVFEGNLTRDGAHRLAERAALHLGPQDSLRVYCIGESGRRSSRVYGAGVLAEAHDFWLL